MDESRSGVSSRKWLWGSAIGLAVATAAAQYVAKVRLGLGDPPLVVRDDKIEYLFKPDSTYHRFGNLVHYNHWSQRSDDYPAAKPTSERRVLVVGNSIVNGGALTDQSAVVTALLQRELSTTLRGKVVVGNASAGGWGPPNELAYLQRFGTLQADAVVFVWDSWDSANVHHDPAAIAGSPDFPTAPPPFALWEAVFRYLPRYLHLPGSEREAGAPPEKLPPPPPGDLARGLADMRSCIRLARASGARAIVAQAPSRPEMGGHWSPLHEAIKALALGEGADVVQIAPFMESAVASGQNPWRDDIHPNARGQQAMADALEPALVAALRGEQNGGR